MEHINRIKAAAVGVLGCLTALWGWFGWLVLAWVACMVLDYATGSAAALRAGEWSSKIARDGLWHKLGAIAIPASNQMLSHDLEYRFGIDD